MQNVEEEKNENEQLMVKVKEVFSWMNVTVLKETIVSTRQMTAHKVLPFIEINNHFHTPPV